MQAWQALQALAGHHEDFRDLLAADAVDEHTAGSWGVHYGQALQLARDLDADLEAYARRS
ncbi:MULTISPECIES: hypothetical protein [Streptomyces]|uniref:Uncharacterized protein n=1 Tax=Streptomyces dengpaensis TaxID=2049881 RepID=A0ABM6T173_9ACTN|nr:MULTISPECIES: hypothetical protein [Streptomyces]AVH60754.1 hypothetical protein C4B68_38990 [Streptomyces dengpaensis]PIB04240.1 hypothetical protein B1C81_33805 [Streptomyces sp. HG99]